MWKKWADSNLAVLGPFLLMSMWEVDSSKTRPISPAALVPNKIDVVVIDFWENCDGVLNKKKNSTFLPVKLVHWEEGN